MRSPGANGTKLFSEVDEYMDQARLDVQEDLEPLNGDAAYMGTNERDLATSCTMLSVFVSDKSK